MKILNIILKVILCLILMMPILGATGIFPPPTPDLYNTPQAFNFIEILMQTRYITYIMAMVFAASIVLLIIGRTALVALLILPITVNIVSFHLFLDGGLFTPGAIPGNILLLLNLYFLWNSRKQYAFLWEKNS